MTPSLFVFGVTDTGVVSCFIFSMILPIPFFSEEYEAPVVGRMCVEGGFFSA